MKTGKKIQLMSCSRMIDCVREEGSHYNWVAKDCIDINEGQAWFKARYNFKMDPPISNIILLSFSYMIYVYINLNFSKNYSHGPVTFLYL